MSINEKMKFSGRKMRDIRVSKQISEGQMIADCGIHFVRFLHFEKDQKVPSQKEVMAMADRLGVSPEDLYVSEEDFINRRFEDAIEGIQLDIDIDNAHIRLIEATEAPKRRGKIKRRCDLTPQYLSGFYGVPVGRIIEKIKGLEWDKTLYLIRGLSGSGKTTLAHTIARGLDVPYNDHQSATISADDFFLIDGVYCFDRTKLKEAHEQCQNRCNAAMVSGIDYVIIHNTFSCQWEAQWYLDAAKKHGYSVNIIECQSNFGNVHDVPETVVSQMKDRWEEITVGAA